MSEEPSTDDGTEKQKSSKSVNRRRFVRSLGAAGAAGMAATSSASATNTSTDSRRSLSKLRKESEMAENAKEPFDSSVKIRQAFDEHGEELLNDLSSRGLIESSSADSLEIELLSQQEYTNSKKGTTVGAFKKEDTHTAHLMHKQPLRNQRLVLFVQPQISRSYAFVTSDTEDNNLNTEMDDQKPDVEIIDPSRQAQEGVSTNSGGPTPQAVCYGAGCYCSFEGCGGTGSVVSKRQYHRLRCGKAYYQGGLTEKCCTRFFGMHCTNCSSCYST